MTQISFTPRGTLTQDRPLSDLTWLRVGGPADWFFQPEDEDDLAAFLAAFAGGPAGLSDGRGVEPDRARRGGFGRW